MIGRRRTAAPPSSQRGTAATPADVDEALRALHDRLATVGAVLLPGGDLFADSTGADADVAHRTGAALETLVAAVRDEPLDDRVWLLIAGLVGALPTRDELDDVRRMLELAQPGRAAADLLAWSLPLTRIAGAPLARIDVLVGGVLVDVDFTARHDLHTGIQRVVRQTLPLWQLEHAVVPVAWTSGRGAPRRLTPTEESRVLQWSATRSTGPGDEDWAQVAPDRDDRVVIPWRSVVVVPEVPQPDVTPRLAALAAVSGNRMVAVGHDAIPLLSADTLDLAEPDKYMAYLAAVKYATRVAGVSRSATAEFAAFATMLGAQGLTGPVTTAVPLPVDFDTRDVSGPDPTAGHAAGPGLLATPAADGPGATPEVVVVGSHDPRKNHEAVLGAAEILWREGVEFRLSFIGSIGSNEQFLHRLVQLRERGRDVRLLTGLSDAELRTAVAGARFTVFPSLHEGYGLPVAESLALGTPVVTTGYGSTAEIAADGGALVVDPRDDLELAAAMRDVLTDPDTLARLHAEIARRPARTWADYASELWATLVEPELSTLAADSGR